jgi:hypothetical protein
MLWCVEIHYCTCTHTTHFGKSVGFPVPMTIPSHFAAPSDTFWQFPTFFLISDLLLLFSTFYNISWIYISHIHIYNMCSSTCHTFSALFILPLFRILKFWSVHHYSLVLIGQLMLLSFGQLLRSTWRSFQCYSSSSDILFIFISPFLYLNFGITKKNRETFPSSFGTAITLQLCSHSTLWHTHWPPTALCFSSFYRSGTCYTYFHLIWLCFHSPLTPLWLDIAKGQVNHSSHPFRSSFAWLFVCGILPT